MNLETVFQLFLAVGLGGIIGLERELKKREAGLQTYALVSLGACIFALVGTYFVDLSISDSQLRVAPLRIIEATAIGVGFIGAGTIFQRRTFVEGLTTAAGLWVTAAIGVATGVKLYRVAIVSTFLTLVILALLGVLEQKFSPKEK